MIHDDAREDLREHFDISVRFRHVIEQRIARLESDAAVDEFVVSRLENADHIRRQLRLVAAQRAEASRMKQFLENSRTRSAELTER